VNDTPLPRDEPPRRDAVIDSSSAILLFKVGWISLAAASWRLLLPPSVARELTVPRMPGARAFERMIAEGRLVLADPGPEAATPDGAAGRLGAGERDALGLYLSGWGAFVIVDDGRAASVCRTRGIPYINALLVPRVLSRAGQPLPCPWRTAMEELCRQGRYSETVRRHAYGCSDRSLEPFRP
jgi:hypothetical protein